MIQFRVLKCICVATGCLVFAFSWTNRASAEATDLEVVAEKANAMAGTTVLGSLPKGAVYHILKSQKPWYSIELEIGGQKKVGWIHERDVKLIEKAESPVVRIKQPDWLQSVNDKAEVRDGTKSLGYLRRGELRQIKGTNGRWSQVEIDVAGEKTEGWILDTNIRMVPPGFANPALAGQWPASITQATSVVDWKTGEVTLTAAVPWGDPKSAKLVAVRESDTPQASGGESVVITADSMTGPASDVIQRLTPDTRSLWGREGDDQNQKYHRVDLAPVDLQPTVAIHRYPGFTEGLLLAFSAEGVLPGFTVEISDQYPGQSATPFRTVTGKRGFLPRIVDTVRGKNETRDTVRIVVTDKPLVATHFVRLRNPDHSLSKTIAVRRKGNEVDPTAVVTAPGTPAFVDTTVVVPSVELLTVEQAAQTVKQLGLEPRFIEQATLQPRAQAAISTSVIMRQGIEPGVSVLQGEMLLLAVRDDAGASESTISSGESGQMLTQDSEGIGLAGPKADDAKPPVNPDASQPNSNPVEQQPISGGGLIQDGELAQNSTAIDPRDDLDFADVPQSGLITGGGLVNGGGLSTGPSGNPSDLNQSDILDDSNLIDAPTMNPDGNWPDGNLPSDTILMTDFDPGVSLDPTRDEPATILAAILKIVLNALLNQPSSQNLPGPLGLAIKESIQTQEAALIAALSTKPVSSDKLPVEPVFDIVFQKLGLQLAAPLRDELIGEWRSFANVRLNRLRLDRNRNGRVADDVVIWLVTKLYERGLYNPATAGKLTVDAMGHSVAIINDKPISPDWLNDQVPPIVMPGTSQLATSQLQMPTNGTTPGKPNTPTTPVDRPPTGKPVVTAADGPDTVRVPPLHDETVSTDMQRLDSIGLKIANPTVLLRSDRVVEATPAPETWVNSGSLVELQVTRIVPNLLKMSFSQADAELKRWRLKPEYTGKTFTDDTVIAQDPVAGTSIPLSQPVALQFAMTVPYVIGELQEEAASILKKRDLIWVADTKAFRVDKVMQQNPIAGSLAQRGDQIKLELHVAVPNVIGQSLANARATLEKWDLVSDVPNQFALDRDRVTGQSPTGGSYAPHQSTAVLGPVLGIVPDVRGISVMRAQDRLTNSENYRPELYGDILDGDIVTMQNPQPGTELERGKPITLDARVTVPNVNQSNIADARNTVNRADGDLRAVIDGNFAASDIVYSQQPQGGVLVFPRTTISLVPGVFVPRLYGLSPNQVDRALREVAVSGRITSSGTQETTDRSLVGRNVVESQDPRPGLYRREDVGEVKLGMQSYILAVRIVPNVSPVIRSAMTVEQAIETVRRAELTPILLYRGQRYNQVQWLALATASAISASEEIKADLNSYEVQTIYQFRVSGQDPRAGTEVLVNSPVVIEVLSRAAISR